MQAPADVEAAVTEMYRAAPEAFVAARDQLARSLRAAKRRDEAAAIAKLRRPSRLAWAFNAARAADARVAARLDEAVAAVTAAQEGDGSIRQASSGLRAAVADLVDTAARTAADAGHHLDRSTLTPAALAVVGDPEALGQLQNLTFDLPDSMSGEKEDKLASAADVSGAFRGGRYSPSTAYTITGQNTSPPSG